MRELKNSFVRGHPVRRLACMETGRSAFSAAILRLATILLGNHLLVKFNFLNDKRSKKQQKQESKEKRGK